MATLALLCGSQIALIYLVYAVASTVVVLAFGGLNGFASRAYADACFWLAISRRLPWRPMPFLINAERRGVFQEVGAIYRFRHIRVQLQLREWYRLHRFRLRDWQPFLLRLFGQFVTQPTLARLQSKADSYRTLSQQNLAGFGLDLTSALDDLASALREMGRRDDELSVREEIVTVFRAVATVSPGMSSSLAAALEGFAYCLARSGREHEALGVISEAADSYGHLAAPQRREFQARLADWLTRHPFDVGPGRLNRYPFDVGPGRLTPALSIEVNRVADIYRALVRSEPEPDTPAHARAMIQLARTFVRLGRDDEAAAVFSSAAQIYRHLIRVAAGDGTEADTRGIGPLTQALVQIARELERLGQGSQAADALAEALQVYRELTPVGPFRYSRELDHLLTQLVRLSGKLARADELNVIGAVVTVYHDAAEAGAAGFSLNTLNHLSVRLWKLGECDAALEAARTGRRLAGAGSGPENPASAEPRSWEPVTDQDPPRRPPQSGARNSLLQAVGDHFPRVTTAYQWRESADASDTHALRFLVSGCVHESIAASIEAVRCGQAAVDTYRLLAETWPAEHLGDLAQALDLLAGYLRKVAAREFEADEAAREAHEIRRRLRGRSS